MGGRGRGPGESWDWCRGGEGWSSLLAAPSVLAAAASKHCTLVQQAEGTQTGKPAVTASGLGI